MSLFSRPKSPFDFHSEVPAKGFVIEHWMATGDIRVLGWASEKSRAVHDAERAANKYWGGDIRVIPVAEWKREIESAGIG